MLEGGSCEILCIAVTEIPEPVRDGVLTICSGEVGERGGQSGTTRYISGNETGC